jgi:hypothetical protein
MNFTNNICNKGECIYTKIPSTGQVFLVLDIDWFFEAVNKLFTLVNDEKFGKELFEFNSINNVYYIKNELLKNAGFVHLKLADLQQCEFFLELANKFNLVMRFHNEKDNMCYVLSNYLLKSYAKSNTKNSINISHYTKIKVIYII